MGSKLPMVISGAPESWAAVTPVVESKRDGIVAVILIGKGLVEEVEAEDGLAGEARTLRRVVSQRPVLVV